MRKRMRMRMISMICGAGILQKHTTTLSLDQQSDVQRPGVLERVQTFASLFPLLNVLYNHDERSSPRVGLLRCLGFPDDFFILCSDRVGFIKDALKGMLMRRQLRHLRCFHGLRRMNAIFSAIPILCNRLMMILIFRDDSHQRDGRQSQTPFRSCASGFANLCVDRRVAQAAQLLKCKTTRRSKRKDTQSSKLPSLPLPTSHHTLHSGINPRVHISPLPTKNTTTRPNFSIFSVLQCSENLAKAALPTLPYHQQKPYQFRVPLPVAR